MKVLGVKHKLTKIIMKRETLIAFGKLLNRVRFQGTWNPDTFMKCSSKIDNVSKSEAFRFYKALVELGHLIKSGRTYKPSFDTRIWHDDDYRLNIIKSILESQPVIQKRGRIKGKVYDKPATVAVVVSEPTIPLGSISAKELVEELRKRGFEVSCR